MWPKSATIEGSRGCKFDCDFCSWAAMGNVHTIRNGKHVRLPRYRKKAPAQSVQEIDYLYREHGIRYLFWVEGTWNADNEWLDQTCSELIRRNYNIGWWAFCRPDLMLEQEKLGITEKMVRAGLRHVFFGGERTNTEQLREIGKGGDTTPDKVKQALRLFKEKYPVVFRQVTFITGIPSETTESMEEVGRYARECDIEFVAFHVYNPYPGTRAWEKYKDSPLLEERDFSKWDMMGPVMRSEHMSREEISRLNQRMHVEFITKQPLKYMRGMFSRHSLRRRIHWWFFYSNVRVFVKDFIWGFVLRRRKYYGFGNVSVFWKPKWYNN
jgi:anaerobic magnesium-protoporphyrin IX monomethyl ester cyclase